MNQQAQKKGLGALGWIAIGCGVIVVVIGAVLLIGGMFLWNKGKDMAADFEANPGLASARLVVRMNPELEEVAVDEDAGTMTVRNTSTGEEVTVDWSRIEEGKFRWSSSESGDVSIEASDAEGGSFEMRSDKGTYRIGSGAAADDIPSWVPMYPDAEVQSVTSMSDGETRGGSYSLGVDAPVGEVVEFFRSALEAEGLEVRVNTTSAGGGVENALVSGEAEGRNAVVMVGSEGEQTSVTVSFSEKR